MARSTKIFGPKLAKARESRCLTQSQLGEMVGGMSDENISRIERSEVAGIMTHRLPALAEALGISLEELNQTIVAPPDATLSGPRPAGHVLRVSVEVVHGLQRQAEARGLSVEELLANFAGVENRTPRRNAAKPIGKRPAERFRKPRLGQGRPPKPNP